MIVITGASDGLGYQLAKLYKENGKTVVNISRRECEIADHNILADLTDGTAIRKATGEVVAIDETLEAVVNCAGVLSNQELSDITQDEVQRVMSTNVEGAILLISGLTDRIKQDGADIVNVASTAGFKGYVNEAAYAASKWAMRGFSVNLQTELKDTPCRVISFCPGGFKSKLFEKATGKDATLEGQWMNPEDVARFMKQILDLPKNMEVSEVVISRKQVKV